jgi:hypothetical protein
MIQDADVNGAITKLYAIIETYDVADWWYFDMPLALHLKKPFSPIDDGSLMQNCWSPSHIPESILVRCH